MNRNKKELLFLLTILVISFLCSFIPGVKFPLGTTINPLEGEEIISVSNISQDSKINISENDKVFKSGLCYLGNTNYQHSNFYSGNIRTIPTSSYWKYPIDKIESRLQLKKIDKGFEAILEIPFNLDLPIVSLIFNADDFFDQSRGIYVKGEDAYLSASKTFYPMPWNQPANFYRKKDDKRKVFFSYYNNKGESEFSSYSYIEISGKATRCFPQKSLKLKADKSLGDKNFKHDFFNEGRKYESLVLRNGGNDNTKTLFRDMLMENLLGSTSLLVSNFQPCEVFLNGEYWGIHFLQNKLDQDFIAQKMDCKKKNVCIVENFNLDKGSEFEYERLKSVISNLNMKDIEEEIDLDDLINYLAGQIFFGNTDWPNNNLKMYKISGSKSSDTKWRFAFFDLDYGFGYTGKNTVSIDMFEYLKDNNDKFSKLIQFLLKKETFRSKLKARMLDLMENELKISNMIFHIKEYQTILSLAVARHLDRWRKPRSKENWEENIIELIEFSNLRSKFILNHINKHLK